MVGQNPIQVFGLWLNCRAFVFFGKPYVEEYEEKIGEYLEDRLSVSKCWIRYPV